MKKDLTDKIKSRGYWRINFQPVVAVKKLKTLQETKEIVRDNAVRLRGWDYPHFPGRMDDDTGLEPCGEYYQGWIDWANHKEFWRMYKSGQFLHYLALREDWLEDDPWRTDLAQKIKPKTKLGVVGSTIYQITEIMEFLSRLADTGLYDEGLKLSISLNNTEGRELWMESETRLPFIFPYKTGTNKIEIKEELSKEQMISDTQEIGFSIISQIFDTFGWENLPVDTIKKDQNDLLSGKI
jgi:hypothetical protein